MKQLTVQHLINKLQEINDKTLPVHILYKDTTSVYVKNEILWEMDIEGEEFPESIGRVNIYIKRA